MLGWKVFILALGPVCYSQIGVFLQQNKPRGPYPRSNTPQGSTRYIRCICYLLLAMLAAFYPCYIIYIYIYIFVSGPRKTFCMWYYKTTLLLIRSWGVEESVRTHRRTRNRITKGFTKDSQRTNETEAHRTPACPTASRRMIKNQVQVRQILINPMDPSKGPYLGAKPIANT
jgi:hypothetical protein